jgi:DNA-binding GntR family transcriptional regulator
MTSFNDITVSSERLEELEIKLLKHMIETGEQLSRDQIAQLLGISDRVLYILVIKMRSDNLVERSPNNLFCYQLVPLPEDLWTP